MKPPSKLLAVTDKIRREINSGLYHNGQRMPTETEYSATLGVSRQTVRKALGVLEAEGLITRRQGSGSYANTKESGHVRTGRIAVICTYISEYIFPSILRGIENVTKDNGYQLLMNSTNNSIAAERDILSRLLETSVDGIIVEGTKTALPNPNREFYGTLAGRGIPIVFINSFYPDITGSNIIHIVTDDYAGGYAAAERMIRAGHRSICGIFKSDDIQGTHRYAGYTDALIHLGAKMRDNNVIWFSTETKELLLRNIGDFVMGIDRDCTGVVCYNDQIALPVVRFFESSEEYCIRSVSSFDACLPITSGKLDFISYSHPKEQFGTTAATKLFSMIAGHKEDSLVFQWE
jgi:GntR family transcriptional regulator, arabinose operon transcriptional repressor